MFFLIAIVCLSALTSPYYALGEMEQKEFDGSSEIPASQTPRTPVEIAETTPRPSALADDGIINTAEQQLPQLPTEETVNTAEQQLPQLPTEETVNTAEQQLPQLPTEKTEQAINTAEQSAPAPDDISISSGSSGTNSVTNQSSIDEPVKDRSATNDVSSISSNNSSSIDYNDASSDGFISSGIEPTSPSLTNDTSSGIEPTSPSLTNDTSSGIEPTSPSLTNDTSNIGSHPSTNGSALQLAGSSFDTSSGILSSSDPNSVVHEIHPGDSQEFTFRDVSDKTNSTKSTKIKFDKSGGYKIGDSATLTITDKSANLDPNAINTVLVSVTSSSDQFGILVVFTETGPNTGEFRGSFLLSNAQSSFGPIPTIRTKTGDNINIVYVASHARLKASLDGVTQGGEVTVTDFAFSPLQKTFLGFNPVGNGAELTFTGVETNPDSTITVTMSYADAYIVGLPLDEFQIFKSNNGDDWELVNNLDDPVNSRPIIDTSAKTVTVTTTIDTSVPIIFMLGQCDGCGTGGFGSPGGVGGGLPLPGNGVVLDFLSPVVASQPTQPGPAPSLPPSLPNPQSSSELLITTALLEPSDTAALDPSSLSVMNSSTERLINSSSALGQVSDSKSNTLKAANFTVVLPQIGTVVLVFTNLLSQGPIDLTPIQLPSALSELKIEQASDALNSMSVKIGNSTYSMIGTPLQIGSPSVEFEGTLTVSVPYNANLASESDEVRLLFSDGGNWEDLTSGANSKEHIVIGELESLGTVVAAIKSKV
jgi:hypothetical protein